MPVIEQITIRRGTEETTYADILQKKGGDIRERVFLAFADRKIPLLMLKTTRPGLEDVFMELTQKNTVPDAFARRLNQEREEEKQNAGSL